MSPRLVTQSTSRSTVRIARDDPSVAFVGILRLRPRTAPQPEPEPKPIQLPVFFVSKQVYDTFEKIFNKGERGQ